MCYVSGHNVIRFHFMSVFFLFFSFLFNLEKIIKCCNIFCQNSAMAEMGSYDLCPVINWIGSTMPYYAKSQVPEVKMAFIFSI